MNRVKKKKQDWTKYLYHIDADLDLLGYDFTVWKVILFLIGFISAVPSFILMFDEKVVLLISIASFAFLAVYPVLNIIDNIKRERILCESEFILIAAAVSMVLKDYKGAEIILFSYNVLRLLESYFTDKQRIRLGSIVDLIPGDVLMIVDGEPVHKKPSRIKKGDYIGVNSNSVIPADGIVINGSSEVDYSAVCGDDYKASVVKGSKIYSGGFNTKKPIIIQADCDYQNCFVQKVLLLCQNSISVKFNKRITDILALGVPVLLMIAFIVGVICPIFNHQWVNNAKVCIYLLLLCCPYGFFSAISLTNFIAVLSSFANGAILKDATVLDKLARASSFICNKTGTLTEKEFAVEDVCPEEISINNFLSMILNVESVSKGPIANALRFFCGIMAADKPESMSTVEIQGNGIKATIDGNQILVGNSKLLFDYGIFARSAEKPGPVVHAAVNDKYCGYILLSNKIRKTTQDAIEIIRSKGMKNFVLLSGDIQTNVRPMATSMGFNVCKAEIDRNEKTSVTEYLMDNRAGSRTVVYVGNELEEQESASHADVSVATDMVRHMDVIGTSDMDVLSGGIMSFAKVYSTAVSKLQILRIITASYAAVKLLLIILALCKVLEVWLLSALSCFVMMAIFIFIAVRLA